MKSIFVFLLLLPNYLIFSQDIPEIKLEAPDVLRGIDAYIETIELKPNEYGVIILKFDSFEGEHLYDKKASNFHSKTKKYSFVISSKTDEKYIEKLPPSAYSIHKNRPILIYTGLENLVDIDAISVKKLLKRIKFKLAPSWDNLIHIPPFYRVIIGDKTTTIQIDDFPY